MVYFILAEVDASICEASIMLPHWLEVAIVQGFHTVFNVDTHSVGF